GSAKNFLRNPLVATRAQPPAVVVASAQMQSKADPRILGQRIQQLHPLIQNSNRINTVALEDGVPCRRVDEDREFRRIELNMLATHSNQLGYLGSNDLGAVCEEVEDIPIALPRKLWRPEHQQHHGTWERNLDRFG